MECKNCKYFTRDEKEKGECHRYPPKVLLVKIDDIMQVWPIVNEDTFCGEFTLAKERRHKTRSGKFDPM